MGYSITWVVCTPGELWHNGVRLPSVTRWQLEHVFQFGHVTRVEKLEDNPDRYNERHAAAICINTWVLHKLKDVYGTADRKHFAPPILDHTLGRHGMVKRSTAEAWLGLSNIETGEVLDIGLFSDESDEDVWRFDSTPPPLALHEAHGHNVKLAAWPKVEELIKAEAKAGREFMLVIHKQPYLWIPASTVATWLQEAEDRNSNCWTEAQKRPGALARFRALRTFLHELAPIGAHVLFHYH